MPSDAEFAEELVALRDRLLAYARRLTASGDQGDAEDLVQATVERAWARRGTFRGEASASTWVHRILINLAHDRARRTHEVPLAPIPDRPVPDVHHLDLERAEDSAVVRAALSRLSVPDRAVIALRDAEGWSMVDTAAVVGCSVPSTQKRLQRARARLARSVELVRAEKAPVPLLGCSEARVLAAAYLAGTLSDRHALSVEAHLAACAACPPVLQALPTVREAVAGGRLSLRGLSGVATTDQEPDEADVEEPGQQRDDADDREHDTAGAADRGQSHDDHRDSCHDAQQTSGGAVHEGDEGHGSSSVRR
ncbi:RNA polymerase sigma factor SigM [Aeromicrobium marinum DSM 15272]|uniref:RNA polymerase sigma factor SigM n=1 Tax=Aeromicrobium marinum DSM 15272 TaxID=585531 RepID=E2SBW0_9ACTN|nr:sigma-70 family RNA polymerase sigma factor [Aeromicrobium marinum]EFQ83246.1 RNA polymerase sigma factor SigM [Aeromicrobium marinum DSM 15272]